MPKQIPLSRGQVALVDADLFDELNRYKWSALSREGRYYAVRRRQLRNGYEYVYMHREVLGLNSGDRRIGDHRNPALTLVNTRKNLRIATPSQNAMNSRQLRKTITGFKGVWLDKRDGRYSAQICTNRVRTHLGRFATAEEAFAARCEATKRMHGEFARVR